MDMVRGADSQYFSPANMLSNATKTDKIASTLNNSNASDEELMDACKGFEAYLLEQVFKSMEKTVMRDDEEEKNEYLTQFGDMLYESYAEKSVETQSFGIAQMLYDSMKRNV